MANTELPMDPNVQSTLGLVESIQSLRLRAGGPSSSHLLNQLASRTKTDISRLATDVTDVADQTRIFSLLLGSMNAGLSKMYNSLSTQVTSITGMTAGGSHKALADFYLGSNLVSDASLTSADVNPLFGQVILPARTRQNCLVIDRGLGEPPAVPQDSAVLFALQPGTTSTTGAVAPPDYVFAEDPYSVNALINDDRKFWIVEDPTATGHMAWVEIRLPGNVSGAYRCNELEFVPMPAFSSSLVSLQAEVVGQGWQDLDFSYLTGYNRTTKAVPMLGPSRLCFSEASVKRFRLGLWVSGTWGFNHIRVLSASYQASANVTVDFTPYSPGAIQLLTLFGRDPQRLAYLSTTTVGNQVTVTLTPPAASSETPLLTGIGINWQ